MKKIILFLSIFITIVYANTINLDFLMKNSKSPMLIIDPKNGEIINVNKSAALFYGYNIETLKTMNIKEINTFTKKQVQEEMQKAKDENRDHFIFNHKFADGSTHKVQVFSYPIIYNNKDMLFSTIHRLQNQYLLDNFNKNLQQQVTLQISQIEESKKDIVTIFIVSSFLLIFLIFILIYFLKQKKDLAKKLQKSNERFELAMDTTKDGLWDWNPITNKVYFSKAWKEMLGYEENEIQEDLKEWSSRVHPDEIDRALEDIQKHLRAETDFYENIHRMKHKNGSWIWILDRGRAVFDSEGKAIRVIGFHTNITLQKEAQKKIEQQKEEFQKIFYNSNDAIAIVDLETNFLNFNDAYLKLTGFTKEELLKKSCLDLTSSDDIESTKKALELVFKEGHIENLEKICIVKDGRHVQTSMNIALMSDKQRMIVTTRDITKLKNIQSQEKLASMGEMIGNIAHQWRQPLTVITANASALKIQKELGILADEDFHKAMDAIVNQSKYLSETIDDFRAYIKNDKAKEDTTIVEILEKTLSLSEATLKNNYIKVETQFQKDMKIHCFKNEVVQSFLNIINNAIDAIKSNLKAEEPRLIFIKTQETSTSLSVSIKDNAGGIKKEIIPRVFEPYFTTKHQSVGTGIGLSLSHDILTNHHNAQITVMNDEYIYENTNYKGANFIIKFKKT